MSEKVDNAKLSRIIREATQEIVTNTEQYIHSVSDKALEADTVSVMINGSKFQLNREDYSNMKLQNDIIKKEMKKTIQELKNTESN